MKITIKGTTFEMPDRYAAGHVVNENEASVLNQTFMENIGNNFRSKVAEWTGTPEALQSEFTTYASQYNFGTRIARGPSAPTDPIGAEAHRLALVYVKGLLQEAGSKISDYKAADLNEAARQLVESDPSYRTQAEANIEAQQARTASGPGIDLSALLAKAQAKKDAAADESAGTIVGEAQPDAAETPAAEPETPAPEMTEAPRGGRRSRG